ncbi:ABC transporter permease [Hippea alviniae]|uniref:ABC transporter permease n=1 Tax=Hippea alviniae TaxID=1279027 RepID=UPI0003B3EE5A|nr:ABC transporter permease [Hippea alviniae]
MQANKRVYKALSYLLAIITLTAIWEILSILINTPSIPDVFKIWVYFFENLRSVMNNAEVSFLRVFLGILTAFLTAVPLGLLSYSKKIDAISSSFLYVLYPIPHIVLLPLFLILFGLTETSKILFIAFVVFFQIWMSVSDAARNIEEEYTYSLLSLGANRFDIYRHLVLPYVLPKIFTGLRISVGTSIAILFFVESFATSKGLGFMIMDAWSSANYPALYASMMAFAMMGLFMYIAVGILERKTCKWLYQNS